MKRTITEKRGRKPAVRPGKVGQMMVELALENDTNKTQIYSLQDIADIVTKRIGRATPLSRQAVLHCVNRWNGGWRCYPSSKMVNDAQAYLNGAKTESCLIRKKNLLRLGISQRGHKNSHFALVDGPNKSRASAEKLAEVWNSSGSTREVAEKMGLSYNSPSALKSIYSKRFPDIQFIPLTMRRVNKV